MERTGILLLLLLAACFRGMAQPDDNTDEHFADRQDQQCIVYQHTEQMAEFLGGSEQLRAFIRMYLKYPPAAKKEDREGRVVLTFVVQEDGSLTDIRVARSAGKDLDEEAVRLAESMPCWIPGKQNGYAVPVYFHLPVTFKLE